MKRILFVDDEQQLLDGLRNALFRQRREWDMTFVTSGREALDLLEQQPFDVIVSDMRMPGMSGADLLQQVKERFPATARLILSGQSTASDLSRALPSMHQFLSKPCDPLELKETIDCVCRTQLLLADERLRHLAGKLDRLPSRPDSCQMIIEALARDDVKAERITTLIENDVALSAKVLQLANSSYFGSGRRVNTVSSAVQQIGVNVIQALALAAQLFREADSDLLQIPAFAQLSERALLRHRIVLALSRDTRGGDAAATAALLLDFGQLVYAVGSRHTYIELLQRHGNDAEALLQAELATFGVGSAQMGAYVLGLWGLPIVVIDMIARHRAPELASESSLLPLASVHMAWLAVDAEFCGRQDVSQQLDARLAQRKEVASNLNSWTAIIRNILDEHRAQRTETVSVV